MGGADQEQGGEDVEGEEDEDEVSGRKHLDIMEKGMKNRKKRGSEKQVMKGSMVTTPIINNKGLLVWLAVVEQIRQL